MAHAAHSMPEFEAMLEGASPATADASGLSETDRRVDREVRIAGAIVEVARREAACLGGARLLRVGVTVGADCNINPLCMQEAFHRMICRTELEHVVLHVKSVARRHLCHDCGREFSSADRASHCPGCTSPDPELIGGDELELTFIEVERA